MSDLYRLLYSFFKNRLKEDDFMSWFRTLGILGFLYTLNVTSFVHLFLSNNHIDLNKVAYITLFLTPLIIHFLYFYGINNDKKEDILKVKSKISAKTKIAFLIYIIFSKILFFYTLILWADS